MSTDATGREQDTYRRATRWSICVERLGMDRKRDWCGAVETYAHVRLTELEPAWL